MELTDIRGISDKKAADFNKLGVFTTEDLVGYFPRREIKPEQVIAKIEGIIN